MIAIHSNESAATIYQAAAFMALPGDGDEPKRSPEIEPEKIPQEDPGIQPDTNPRKEDDDDDDDDDDDYTPYTEPEIGDDPDREKNKMPVM